MLLDGGVCCRLPYLSTSCDETRDACLHHFIEPLPGLNAIDFVKRVLWKGGDVKTLSRELRIWVW